MNCFNINFILFTCCFLPLNYAAVEKPSKHLDEKWKEYKEQYNRTYNPSVEKIRRLEWEKNYYKVKKHNEEHKRGMHSYKLGLNHLADLSQKQYIREMVRLASSKRTPFNNEITLLHQYNVSALPVELDWRKEGFNTGPFNQEDCGSCYAFSIASCIQGQYFKIRKQIKNFR